MCYLYSLDVLWNKNKYIFLNLLSPFNRLLYYSAFTPQPVIVLEDLCAAGYDILRERLFNCNEVKQCLQKLAKWYAVSYKLATLSDPDVTALQRGLFKNSGLVNSDYISDGIDAMIRALEVTGGFERFLPKLKLMAPQLIARCIAMNDAYANGLTGPIHVLNHGDFHTKNIMVKQSDANTLEDLLFVSMSEMFIKIFIECKVKLYLNFVVWADDDNVGELMTGNICNDLRLL